MKKRVLPGVLILMAIVCAPSLFAQQSYRYADIAERYPQHPVPAEVVSQARMQGECLVGIKQLNFRKKRDFDPVAEWSSFRTGALLQQYPPCEVLIILEVAQQALRE